MMKVSLLSLTLVVSSTTADRSAFVPPSVGLRSAAFFSTKPQTAPVETITADDDVLNQEKFLMDLESSDLANMIQADPEYITEARLRFAALADECEALKQQYSEEITQLKTKKVWDSFDQKRVVPKPSKAGNGAVGMASLFLTGAAAATVVAVDPTAVTNFLSNINVNGGDFQLPAVDLSALQLVNLNLDLDLSSVSMAMQDLSVKTSDLVATTAASVTSQFKDLDLENKLQNFQSESSLRLAQFQSQMDASTVQLQQSVKEAMAGSGEALAQVQQSLQEAMAGSDQTLAQVQKSVEEVIASSQVTLAQAQQSVQDAIGGSELILVNVQQSMQEAMASSQVTLANVQQELTTLGSSWTESLVPTVGNLFASAQQFFSSFQEQASAELKGVQESLANLELDTSFLTSAAEEVKALLKQ